MTPPHAMLSKVHRLFSLRMWRVWRSGFTRGWGGVPGLCGVFVSSPARLIVRMVSLGRLLNE